MATSETHKEELFGSMKCLFDRKNNCFKAKVPYSRINYIVEGENNNGTLRITIKNLANEELQETQYFYLKTGKSESDILYESFNSVLREIEILHELFNDRREAGADRRDDEPRRKGQVEFKGIDRRKKKYFNVDVKRRVRTRRTEDRDSRHATNLQ